ncbi:hypothetical protein WJX72_001703 [[Myrmecia] bisecta]|uniref:Uncharacterized protein n=1 Tax=[Myrmecia] bisecta TaxID=41462 RepID=A0AAW1R4S1_9CHLO
MATAHVSSTKYDFTDIAILGGGISGMMTAERCAYAAFYQWHKKYPLDTNPFKKVPANKVLDTIRKWIVPYSQQFKFVYLSHNPFLPRSWRCANINTWLRDLYKECGIEDMAPALGTAHNFTGQCNDAFFQLAKALVSTGMAKLLSDWVVSVRGAVGCEMQYKPPFLGHLRLGYDDLHNFTFLGKNPRIGTASDWVWFNVPHGPQKQMDCFFRAYECWRLGKEQARDAAYLRSLTAGRSMLGKVFMRVEVTCSAVSLWLLCGVMHVAEAISLRGWLDKVEKVSSQPASPQGTR